MSTKRPIIRTAWARAGLVAVALAAPARPVVAAPAGSATRATLTNRAGSRPLGARPRYVGSQAYFHSIRAEVSAGRGDLTAAAEELQLALVYDAESPYLTTRLAEVSLDLGALPRADRFSDRARELAPSDPRVWLLRGRVLGAKGEAEGAERALRRAIELLPAGTEAPLELAKILAESGRTDEAVATLSASAERSPKAIAALARVAELEAKRRRPGVAAKALERALEREPASLALVRSLSDLYIREARFEDAAKRWRRLAELTPEDPRALLGAARAELWLDEDDAARRHVESIHWMAPDLERDVGLMYLEEGRLSEASSILADVVRARPSDQAARLALGLALETQGKAEAALAELELVAADRAADPAAEAGLWVDARVRIVHALLGLGRFDRARLSAAAALAKVPASPSLIALYALVLERSGDADEARRFLAEARRERPQDLELAEAEAGLFLRAGERDRGTRALAAAVEASGSSEDGLLRLGAFAERAGDTEGALAIMQRVVREHPDSSRGLTAVGRLLVEQGARLDEATRLLRRALAIQGSDADTERTASAPRSPARGAARGASADRAAILDALGWAANKQGRLDEAVRLLRQAAHLAPADAAIAERAGDVLLTRGERPEARESYVRSRDLLTRAAAAKEPESRAALERVRRKLAELPGPSRAEP